MSHQASHWALEQACATATEKAILMVLASYVGTDGSCYPGQDTIARQACCSVKSVERALQAFEERGWLIRTARRRKDGSRTSDLLELTLASNPEVREQADTVSGRPEPTRHLVQTNPTPCPNQPDRVSGLTTFEPVRTEPVSEPVSAHDARAENDNLPDLFSRDAPLARPKRGKAKAEPTDAERAEFDGFWSVYPRKAGKQPALLAYVAALRSGTRPEDIFVGAQFYAAAREGQDPTHTKMAQGWLNDKRWTDEIAEPPQGGYRGRHGGPSGWNALDQAVEGFDWDHSEDAA
ncbi:hypothetical protein GCM10017620_24810 [Brevundimonas intermedia]|uniref:Helix-turn-helix domain-containing protein n=1 Tax=Brevundimonas intermedia TaxID=74315 RepID=A0ABQ5TAX5_9CAUL|nr:helix-turn-helix domain-containing protein [Brevundimonas intermedia]GLK49508.1 hypothetical protein GCM10017620_24810 [Brevundimonas intermedia]